MPQADKPGEHVQVKREKKLSILVVPEGTHDVKSDEALGMNT